MCAHLWRNASWGKGPHQPSRPRLRTAERHTVGALARLPTPADAPPPLAVYVHWPYCGRICPYCDFNVVRARGRESQAARLGDAILADLRAHAALTGARRLVSIFFGGGTPSLMPACLAAEIIAECRLLWAGRGAIEVTLEANPADRATFGAFATAGVNRLSLGVQSLNDSVLRWLGRDHDAADARGAINAAKEACARVSIDLIYALPGQDVAQWRAELTGALEFGCEHLSSYQLTVERGTAFASAQARGAVMTAPTNVAADLFALTQRVTSDAGLPAYEISSHARGAGARSRHNLAYWRGEDYLGIGPGAHGRLTRGDTRFASAAPRAISEYIARVESGRLPEMERLDPREVALERLLMGLRTIGGVAWDALAPLAIGEERLNELRGFVRRKDGRLRLTTRGRLVLDAVLARLVDGA